MRLSGHNMGCNQTWVLLLNHFWKCYWSYSISSICIPGSLNCKPSKSKINCTKDGFSALSTIQRKRNVSCETFISLWSLICRCAGVLPWIWIPVRFAGDISHLTSVLKIFIINWRSNDGFKQSGWCHCPLQDQLWSWPQHSGYFISLIDRP